MAVVRDIPEVQGTEFFALGNRPAEIGKVSGEVKALGKDSLMKDKAERDKKGYGFI